MLVARRSAGPREGAPVPTGIEEGRRPVTRRAYAIAPAIALAMLTLTLLAGRYYGIDLRDPDGIIGSRLLLLWALVLAFWALDVVPRAIVDARRTGAPVGRRIREMARERWSWRRIGIVLGSILAFYITYLCYRNVKSYLPLARPELFDPQLLRAEQAFFGGDPATYLHQLLGTGIAAQLLSTVYLLFLTFVPVSLGFALVWSTDTGAGMWWVSALSLNWVLGALSYFMIPSLGPAFAAPELFSDLPNTGAAVLQQTLLAHREEFLRSPVGSGQLQSVAAFASLHVAIVFTGALVAHLLRLPRPIRVGLWIFLGLTVLATIYFGWHYVIDDVFGAVIGIVAVYVSARLTGWRIEWVSPGTPVQLRGA